MLDNEKKNNYLKMMSEFRMYIPYYGFTGTMIQIMFLKYLCTFEDDRLLNEDLKTLMKYQRMLMSSKVDFSIIAETYHMMERIYGDDHGVLVNALNSLERIFKNDNIVLVDAIEKMELPTTQEELTNLIIYVLSFGESGDISKTAMNTTSTSLVRLVTNILNVDKNDTFLDCFCGLNKTALSIDAKKYIGYEINSEVAAISLMSMIMSGKTDFQLENQDYYMINHNHEANKVFADGPLSMLMRDDAVYQYSLGRKSDPYNVLLPLMDLKDDGIAVVTIPASCLFSSQKSYIELRKKIINDLTAVVSLPPLWSGTSINTNIFVFDRTKKTDRVTFIDATKEGTMLKQTRQYIINDEGINKIMKAINGEIVDEFSCNITKKYLLETVDINLQPNRYLEKKIKNKYRSVSEINKELESVYAELNDLIKE